MVNETSRKGMQHPCVDIDNDSGFIPKLYSKYECENLPIKIIFTNHISSLPAQITNGR